jgi:hypothetical protein
VGLALYLVRTIGEEAGVRSRSTAFRTRGPDSPSGFLPRRHR